MDMNNDFVGYLKNLSDDELATQLERATGRTNRLCDDMIQKIFNTPCGEWISVYDHYGTKEADEMLLTKVMERIKNEYPSLSIEVSRKWGTPLYIRRTNKTYHELVLDEVTRRLREQGKENK